jgi:hypothetical protein
VSGGSKIVDERPPLRIAQQTWDRASPKARRRLISEADILGVQLIIVGHDGHGRYPADPAQGGLGPS